MGQDASYIERRAARYNSMDILQIIKNRRNDYDWRI